MDGITIYFLIVFIVFLISLAINIFIATKFSKIAAMKGHTEGSWFWICFFFGFVGWLMVIALPDRKRKPKNPVNNHPPKNAYPPAYYNNQALRNEINDETQNRQ